MKKIILMIIITSICLGCGDSFSELTYSINNQTQYDIILYFTGQEFENKDSILCLSNKETIIFQMEIWSPKKLYCDPYPLKEYAKFVVDDSKKYLIKDISDINNWECTGKTDWHILMMGSYYNNIKSTFIITEEDLE